MVEAALSTRWPESQIAPSLDRIQELLDLLGSPQDAYPVILVAGTNGKTSTARMIDALLTAFGLSVGRYTSPAPVVGDRADRPGRQPGGRRALRGRLPRHRPLPRSRGLAPRGPAVVLRGHDRPRLRGVRRRARRRRRRRGRDGRHLGRHQRGHPRRLGRHARRARPPGLPRLDARGDRRREGRDHQGRGHRRPRPAGPRGRRGAAPTGRRDRFGRGARGDRVRASRAARSPSVGSCSPSRASAAPTTTSSCRCTAPTRRTTPPPRWLRSRRSSAAGAGSSTSTTSVRASRR